MLSIIILFLLCLFFFHRAINQEIINEIIKFCEDNSKEASNKTVKFQGNDVPVKYLDKPYIHLHQDFVQQNPGYQISRSSFRKYIPGYFQRGSEKRTDMCNYCVHGEKAVQQLKRIEEYQRQNQVMSSEIQKDLQEVI